jgi:hypothetical protein
LKYISQPLPKGHHPHIRFNDGACDSKGRFFAGTIYSKDKGLPGQLWRYDPADRSCVVVDEGPFTVCHPLPHTRGEYTLTVDLQDSNGLGWSPDEKTLYIIFIASACLQRSHDTVILRTHLQTSYTRMTIMTERYRTGGCSPTPERKDYPTKPLPMACASIAKVVYGAHGQLRLVRIVMTACNISCRWNGSRVIRFTKDGTIDAEIFFPTVFRVTACCFGGRLLFPSLY